MADTTAEEFDILIVGAGISGVGAAYHLGDQMPEASYVVLESKDTFGGTWVTHTYPGIRSDSDLYTFGYRFKPWTGLPIATAEEILNYMGEVIEENDLSRHIRYNHKISTASWSTDAKRWEIVATDGDGRERRFVARFLWMCSGYYNHDTPFTPTWDGMDDFEGDIVHPMQWPDDLDYSGKQIVVIGSGATAATLIPNLADDAEHVTMLQRSPTYFATGRNHNELANELRQLEIDETWIHEIVRRKILFDQAEVVRACVAAPELVKAELADGIREYLGPDAELSPDFTPSYRPWRQRIAFVPDGDLFKSIADGSASVVTDQIDRFTSKGILTESGTELQADIIVTATGFNLNVLGDIEFTIDDEPMVFSDTIGYRAMMFTGVPNMAWVFGYFRASWTLKADLVADFVIRLLKHMEELGAEMVVPTLRPDEESMPLLPWVDPENFNPGYLMRSLHLMPKQGDRDPWRHTQDYSEEKVALPEADLDDGTLVYR